MSALPVPETVVEGPALRELRLQVRSWLDEQVAAGVFVPRVDNWLTEWDRDFSRSLARQGWLGMVIPVEYGGRGRTHLERFVVTEELLVAGAPVGSHWVAERQIGPSLLTVGTEQQKRELLPGIAAGEISFAIGMSEPDSGSDLASVRTRATRVEGGWRLTGTKVWTSGAHEADYFFALARSEPLDLAHRHRGLSSFIVDLHDPAVQISPILSTGGRHHFNEVHLDGLFVPDARVLGRPGQGWDLVTAELGYERSGPERLLSTFLLLGAAVDAMHEGALPRDDTLGRSVARLTALHHLSFGVSHALASGEPADVQAAMVKDLGTMLEGDITEAVDALVSTDWHDEELFTRLHTALLHRPGFTLRGGTNEVLRGVIARGLGLR